MSELHKFIFEGLPVRGAIVRLTQGWQEMLSRKSYPPIVQNVLGEMTAAALLMHSNIKYDGSLILQILGSEHKDDSAIKLAVVEVTSQLSCRTTAKVLREITDGEPFSALINAGGQSKCAITLMPERLHQGQQPYQSVVPLYGDDGESLESFATVLEHYMLQSEQLDTKLILAANDKLAAGILIQRLPTKGALNLAGEVINTDDEDQIGKNEDFNRIATLAASLKTEELLTLPVDDILHRLFWNEPIARYPAANPAPHFRCTCSKERVAQTIRSLGQTEAEKAIEEKDGIEVNCEFCGQLYRFDVIDAAMLFMPDAGIFTAQPSSIQ
jgi:molecular chaperone Hsp33